MSPLLISVFEFFRSYGRAPKMIHLESNFVQFKEELLPKEGNKALLTFPFLHIYWTECCVSIRKTKFNRFGFLLAFSVVVFLLAFSCLFEQLSFQCINMHTQCIRNFVNVSTYKWYL